MCISQDTLGAALFCTTPLHLSKQAFYPLLTTVTEEKNGIAIELFSLSNEPLQTVSMNIKKILEFGPDEKVYPHPTMAMGSSPPVLCLCWKIYLIIIVRDRGLLVQYEFSESELKLIFKHKLNRYIVDAGMKSNGDNVQVSALISEPDTKDGRIITVHLK